MRSLTLLVVLGIAAGCGDGLHPAYITAPSGRKIYRPRPASELIVPQRSPIVSQSVQTGYRVLPRPKTPSTGMLNPRTGRPFEHSSLPAVAENPKGTVTGTANDSSVTVERKPIAAERQHKVTLVAVVPESPRPTDIIDARFAIKVDGGNVIGFACYGPDGKRIEAFWNSPSQCNDYCGGETRYTVVGVKSRSRYRGEFVVDGDSPDLTTSVLYTFVMPYGEYQRLNGKAVYGKEPK